MNNEKKKRESMLTMTVVKVDKERIPDKEKKE